MVQNPRRPGFLGAPTSHPKYSILCGTIHRSPSIPGAMPGHAGRLTSSSLYLISFDEAQGSKRITPQAMIRKHAIKYYVSQTQRYLCIWVYAFIVSFANFVMATMPASLFTGYILEAELALGDLSAP
ncbi:hypothetical protein WG66_002111 [Moniliophthora roreri]|nr:hypothetical protein WG66_002111 [Moniliophthora roreri]